jgi:hypothetical protein
MSTNDNGDGAVQGNGEANRPPEGEQQVEQPRFPTRQEFDQLVQQANDGNTGAQTRLHRILDECPEIWMQTGNLAEHAELSLVRLIAKEEWLLTESIRRQAAEMKVELAGPNPTFLEAMAVQRVIACWLQLQHVDALCAQADGELGRANFWLKRQSQANKQFNAAMKSLLMIRTLLPPALGPGRRPPAAIPGLAEESQAPRDGGGGEGSNGDGTAPVPMYPANDHSSLGSGGNGHGANRIAALVNGSR